MSQGLSTEGNTSLPWGCTLWALVGKARRLVDCSYPLSHNNEFKGLSVKRPDPHTIFCAKFAWWRQCFYIYIYTYIWYYIIEIYGVYLVRNRSSFYFFLCSLFVFLSVARLCGECCECFDAKSWWLSAWRLTMQPWGCAAFAGVCLCGSVPYLTPHKHFLTTPTCRWQNMLLRLCILWFFLLFRFIQNFLGCPGAADLPGLSWKRLKSRSCRIPFFSSLLPPFIVEFILCVQSRTGQFALGSLAFAEVLPGVYAAFSCGVGKRVVFGWLLFCFVL